MSFDEYRLYLAGVISVARGGGLFVGQYTPKDRDGHSLGKTFNVFAAPQDLTDEFGKKETFEYLDAVKRVAKLKNWNGHDGTNYATDKELYRALKDGSYDGGWIIPPRKILKENLYASKDKDALKGTFCTAAGMQPALVGYPDWYWSSTERFADSHLMHIVRLSDGHEGWNNRDNHRDNYRLSCRPVRLVEVPHS